MKKALDAQLSSFPKANSLDNTRLAHQQRLAGAFIDFIGNDEAAAVLDVHMVPTDLSVNSRHTLQMFMEDRRETSISAATEKAGRRAWNTYPVKQDAAAEEMRLPFSDGEYDWVFCDAVIEHMGNAEQQRALLSELWRVARKGIFVTASNKRHPIEFNTGLPVLHWLPRSAWKASLNWFGKAAWQDRLPNLLDAASIGRLAEALPGMPSYDIGHIRMAGIKAQFFLMVKK